MNRDGTITLDLTYDEYCALGATLVSSGDILAAAMRSNERDPFAGSLLALITGIIHKLCAARNAKGWDTPVEPAIN